MRGRPKGARNKATVVAEIIEKAFESGPLKGKDDLIIELLKIGYNPKTAATTRVAALGKVADYLYPRKGVEAPTQATQQVSLTVNLGKDKEPVTINGKASTIPDEEGD